MSSAPSRADLEIVVSVAWPVWDGGYPEPTEALRIVEANVEELRSEFLRVLTTRFHTKLAVWVRCEVGDYESIPDQVPDVVPAERVANSLRLRIRLELGAPDDRARVPADIASALLIEATRRVLVPWMPGADRGAGAYWFSTGGARVEPRIYEPTDLLRYVLTISTRGGLVPMGYGLAAADGKVVTAAEVVAEEQEVRLQTKAGVVAQATVDVDAPDLGIVRLKTDVALGRGLVPVVGSAGGDGPFEIFVKDDDGIRVQRFDGPLDRLTEATQPDLAVGTPVFAGGRAVALVRGGGRPPVPLTTITRRLASAVPQPAGSWPIGDRPTVPIDARDWEAYAEDAREVLARADAVRAQGDRRRVHTEHLAAALADGPAGAFARAVSAAGRQPPSVREILSAPRLGTNLPVDYDARPLTALPVFSGHADAAVLAAAHTARYTGAARITEEHLAYGLLSVDGCSVVEALAEAGIGRAGVGLRFPPRSEVAVIRPDTATGEDLLGLDREVAALAAVIAAEDVKPPLSIGLFGDWGSGKTFFMKELETRVRAYRDEAVGDPDSVFCPNVVQLWFNAWHYMDANLWASLASEIFEQLGQELDSRLTEADRAAGRLSPREQLMAAAVNTRDLLTDAEKRRDEARRELAAAEARLERLDDERLDIEQRLDARAIARLSYRAVLNDKQVRSQLAEVGQQLGLPEAHAVQQDVQVELLGLGGSGGGLGRALVLSRRSLWRRLLLTVGVTAVGLLVVWAVREGLNALVTAALPMIVAVGGVVTAVVPWVRSAVAAHRTVRDKYDEAIEEQQAAIRTREKAKLEATRQQEATAQREVDTNRDQLADLETQLTVLRADERVAQFIHERNESRDYARYFGSVALARTDFERLRKLLQDVTAETEKSGLPETKDGFPRIDRIVLYIDDLDRCPEDKVVAVLQAVHLLLAIPLFVVVVGVDSRWLLHSLRQHSKVFDSGEEQAEDDPDDTRAHWQSTPLNYLEKIFQIPFTLRPMDSDGFARMIRKLAGPVTGTSARSAAVPAPAAVSAEEDDGPTAAHAGQPAEPVEPVEEIPRPGPVATTPDAGTATTVPSRVTARFLEIEPWEVSTMALLHPLVPTPRAAKRFLNVYRLLRATLSAEEFDDFVRQDRGDHQAVLLLLAIVTGHPVTATEVLAMLTEETEETSWWEFVDGLSPWDDDPDDPGPYPELVRDLDHVRSDFAAVPSLARFRRWAPRVARYSFQPGRTISHIPAGRGGGHGTAGSEPRQDQQADRDGVVQGEAPEL